MCLTPGSAARCELEQDTLSMPQFPQAQEGDTKSACPKGLL